MSVSKNTYEEDTRLVDPSLEFFSQKQFWFLKMTFYKKPPCSLSYIGIYDEFSKWIAMEL